MNWRHGWVKPMTIKLVFVAFLLSLHDQGVRSKTDLLGIRIMCSSGEAILPTDFCFSELTLWKDI